ncbi:hypothetical protein ABFT23_14020 [Nocardioides sp. C4-1]|uniref:hypothetical protein n=1 Tax=Nocardioides sp. C4-1 TaxID=3151851 RepID=UPI003266A75A
MSTTTGRTGFTDRELVLGAVLSLVAVHVAVRVWMLWPSFFYGDDFVLLGEAARAGASPGALVEPYAGQFMPLGRLLAWVVSDAGPLSWHTAALSIVVLVALADLACAWMLLELFGRRWGVLLPLTAYLTTAVLLPATMWWAAALNQLPLQAVLFAAVAAWVRYLRTGRARWWVLACAVVGLGLLAYVKTLLVVGVLAWLTLAHFATGGARDRVRAVVRQHWRPALVLVVGAAAFVTWYLVAVPSIVSRGAPVAADLAGSMLGRALPTGLVGGPWRWDAVIAPAALADPPAWSVALAWVVLGGAAVALALRRRRTGRVWALLLGYAGVAYLLVLATRAPVAGGVIGLEYRYLTDVAAVAALCLGLATLPVRGAAEPTEPRPAPRLRLPDSVTRRTPAVVGAVLAVSGLVSSVGYARIWHTDHPAHAWFERVDYDLHDRGDVDVADAPVPEPVVSALFSPWDTLSRLLPQAGYDVSFPQVSTRIAHVDGFGRVSQGVVDPVVVGVPGPEEGCGYRLGRGARAVRSVTVPFEREVPPGVYWLRIGYLASSAETLTVSAGAASGRAEVSTGLGSVFVDLAHGAAEVTISVVGDATVCIGDVDAGPLEEGPDW